MSEHFDVVVVGSGAAGGMACHVLTQHGARVCLLEAGRHYDPLAETPMFNTAHEAPLRGVPTPDKAFGYYDATINGGWDIPGEPYSIAEGDQFLWWRTRMLGGRTNHWGRYSLRYAPHDLKARSVDGLGVDWPLDYQQLSPYYDRVERLVGIFGSVTGLEDAPDSPPDALLPPPPPRAHEYFMQQVGHKLGRPLASTHAAVLTRPHHGRAACIYATPCLRGCSLRANFQTTTVLLPPALETGRLTIRTDAMAYEVEAGANGKARGVRYIHKATGEHRHVRADTVMLAASAMESVRILLNSRSAAHPDGIGNARGLVGRYISDTVGSMYTAQVPALEALEPHNDFGASVDHLYVPWWGLAQKRAGRLDFPRGYHFELGGGRSEPGEFMLGKLLQLSRSHSGSVLKDELRRYYGSVITLTQRGEMIPNERSYMELDARAKDRWGLPVPRFHFAFGETERRQTAHARQSAMEFFDAAGAKALAAPASETGISVGGSIIHEIGGARMGGSEKDSVTDSFGEVWSMRGLYLIDGATFPTHPHKNPTLSILALAWRACDRWREQRQRGD